MDRSRMYKNKDKDGAELRRRRQDESVELRKGKKEDTLQKRRNICATDSGNEDESLPIEQKQKTPLLPAPKDPSDDAQKCVSELMHLAHTGANDIQQVKDCVTTCRSLLSRVSNPPIDVFVNGGAVPALMALLNDNVPSDLQFEAMWALTNIASGTSVHTKAVVDANCLDAFIRLLDSPDKNVAEQAVWALGNIAGDGAEYRNLTINKGMIEPLLKLLDRSKDNPTLIAHIVWVMSNICRCKNRVAPSPLWVLERVIPYIANVALKKGYASNVDARLDAYWALTYASECSYDDILELIMKTGVIKHMVDLLTLDERENVLTPSLRCVGNMLTGSDDLTDRVIKYGLLPRLSVLLTHKKATIVKETCWLLSNITAGTHAQIEQVIQSNSILTTVVELLEKGDSKTQREALWTISNIVSSGKPEHIQYALDIKVLSASAHLLRDSQPKIVILCMELIHNLLTFARDKGILEDYAVEFESVDGLDMLENLQEHENTDIYNHAFSLIEEFFGPENDPTTATSNTGIGADANQGPTFSF